MPYLGSPIADVLISIAFSLIGYTFMKCVIAFICGMYVYVHGGAPQICDDSGMDVWAGAASVCSIIAHCSYYIAANNGVPATVIGPASVGYVVLPMIYESVVKGCLGVLPSIGIFSTLGGALMLAVSKTGSFKLVWCVYILFIWLGYGNVILMMQKSRFNKSIKRLPSFSSSATSPASRTSIAGDSPVGPFDTLDVEDASTISEVTDDKDVSATPTVMGIKFDLIEKLENFCATTRAQVMVESTVICLSLVGWGIQTELKGSLSPDVWFTMLYGACFAIGTIFFFIALAFSENASIPTAACNLFVVVPVVYGWAVLNEVIALTRVLGAVLALVGSISLILLA